MEDNTNNHLLYAKRFKEENNCKYYNNFIAAGCILNTKNRYSYSGNYNKEIIINSK